MPSGRFAPSPTGRLHLGNLRTALVAWLAARSTGSAFHLRIEDLDPVASSREHEQLQVADLLALGLDWDGPVVRQSERSDLYRDALHSLTRRDLVYPCWCSRREIAEATSAPNRPDLPEGAYPGTCRDLGSAARRERERSGRPAALRIRGGGAVRSFTDTVCGLSTGTVDDFVLRRGDGMHAYNLAVVVDDAAQSIEQVVRADDLLSSTPRQILLAELLGLPAKQWAHVPLVVNARGERLAKRDGAVTLADQAALGRSPAVVCAVLARSLGLLSETDDPVEVHPSDLLARLDLATLPTVPWTPDALFSVSVVAAPNRSSRPQIGPI